MFMTLTIVLTLCAAGEAMFQDKAVPFAPLPDTISQAAHKYLSDQPDPATLPGWPKPDDHAGWKKTWQAAETATTAKVRAVLERFGPKITERKIKGVPVLDIKPRDWRDDGKVLVHAHGGGYVFYSARSRLQSSVPAADATGLRVISVDYTVAPAGKWQRVTDEFIAVLDGLRTEGIELRNIAVYGESAGGGLVAGSILKMRDQGKGMPAAVVLWSPWADLGDRGDSALTLKRFDPAHVYAGQLERAAAAYADPRDHKHPYVSPVYGDYRKGFPPTLIQGGTREIFLSHCVRQYRAIDDAGGQAILDLYEGMPHIFQVRPELYDAPETRAAFRKMASFLQRHLRIQD